MEVLFSKRQNISVAHLSGELDHHSCKYIKGKLEIEIKKPGVKGLILDMSGVTFMDSSGMGLVVARQRLARQRGISVALAAPGGEVAKVISLTGLDRYIGVYETIDDAAEALRKNSR